MGIAPLYVKESGRQVYSISRYVENATEPSPYMYSGELEGIKARAEKTATILGNLIEHLYNKGKLSLDEITSITETFEELVKQE